MPLIKTLPENRVKPESTYLRDFKKDVYSQNGEDGVIEKIFDRIGAETSWCVEFGAWDGVHLSNTCNLIRNCGWSAVQIEGSRQKCQALFENFGDNPRAHPLHRTIGFERGDDCLDEVLTETPIPRRFDLLSIDVDGNDYHIWESLVDYLPRVVVIEFNPRVPNRVVFVQDRNPNVNQGSSAAALVELGKRKGYELAAVLGGNCIFVREDEFGKIGIADNSLEAMRADVEGSIFCGFDGTIYNTLGNLGWQHRTVEVPNDGLQILEKSERKYGGAVTDRS